MDAAAIKAAAALLEQGKLVALPTETVYGLGADAENPAAVAAIFAAKGRPSDHPVIVHLAAGADLSHWAVAIPPEAEKLTAAFWPGPLTLILKRAPAIPDAVSGGQDSIGLRCPSHPVAQALLQLFKNGHGGIAAPSANRFGHVSPTTAQHVLDEFGSDEHSPLACVLNGGQSEVGIESTIVDLSRMATHGPVLLRPGQISAAQIAAVIGMTPAAPDAAAPRASGTLEAHYAPRTPVALIPASELAQVMQALAQKGRRFVLMHCMSGVELQKASQPALLAQRKLLSDPDGYAHALYACMRELDRLGSDIMLIEKPPADSNWQGVNDRLRRAAFDSTAVLAGLM
jgi:L-threonylcarbamoyladenylate synthase